MSVDPNIQRVILLGTLGYTFYIIAVCPCDQMGNCKKEQFLALASIPMAFAIYNFVEEGSCSI
jgi:hypothetical protein